MQQRVALARALVLEPKVLLLDEPLGALEQKLRKAMQLEHKRLQADVGITFVFVTHAQEEAMTMADRIAVMNDGRIEQLAAPSALYDEPTTDFVARFIGDLSELEGTLAGDEVIVADGGRVPLGRRLTDVPNGRQVRVGLRPEAAAVSRSKGVLDATVVTAMVLGDRLQVVVRLGDGQELLIRQPREAGSEALVGLQPDDAVALMFAAQAGLLLGGANDGHAAPAEEAAAPERSLERAS
jgi:spermidine/putrescine transport system ATP-binding protein